MEWTTLAILLFGTVLVLVFSGLPIAVTLIGTSLIFLVVARGFTMAGIMISAELYEFWSHWTLLAIPLFILMGEFLFKGGAAQDIYEIASKWFGHLRGGLALVTVVACAIFASMCGSSAGATATMSVVAAPEMKKRGYGDRLTCGCSCAAGALAHLIPPSVLMVVYASLVEISPGRALIAAFIPGFMLAGFYAITVLIWVSVKPEDARKEPPAPFREKIGILRTVWQPAVIVFGVMGTIFLGIATVTEAASVGGLAALAIAILKKRKAFIKEFAQTLISAATMSCFIMFIASGGKILSLAMNYFLLPGYMINFVNAMGLLPWGFIIMLMGIYVVLGCFIDPIGMMVVTLPVAVPVLIGMGYDLYWFGVMCMVNFEMALITPPFGGQLYILKGVRPEVPLSEILLGALTFFPSMILTLIILLLFPSIATWLPNLMMG